VTPPALLAPAERAPSGERPPLRRGAQYALALSVAAFLGKPRAVDTGTLALSLVALVALAFLITMVVIVALSRR
jgi:hypothetical protein